MSKKFIDRQLMEYIRTALERYKPARESDITLFACVINANYFTKRPIGFENIIKAWRDKTIPTPDTVARYARLLKKKNRHLAGALQLEKMKKKEQVRKEIREHSRPPEPMITLDI